MWISTSFYTQSNVKIETRREQESVTRHQEETQLLEENPPNNRQAHAGAKRERQARENETSFSDRWANVTLPSMGTAVPEGEARLSEDGKEDLKTVSQVFQI